MSIVRVAPLALVLSCAGLKAGDVAGPAADAGADASPGADGGDAGAATDFYVDVAATGDEVGTLALPFHTITAATAAAHASNATNRTIHVAKGTYDAEHHEVFPINLQGGISLIGAGMGKTVVSGHGRFAPNASATGTGPSLRGGQLSFYVGDAALAATLSGITLVPDLASMDPDAGVAIEPVTGILCDRGNAPQPGDPLSTPTMTIDHVTIGPHFENSIVAAATWAPAASGCNLRVLASVVNQGGVGIWTIGCGTDTPVPLAALSRSYVALQVGDGTVPGGNVFRGQSYFRAGAGLSIWNCTSNLDVRGNTFSTSENGIIITRYQDNTMPTSMVIAANTFDSNTMAGLYLTGAAIVDDLHDNNFSATSATDGTAAAILVDGTKNAPATFPGIVSARANLFVGNDSALLLIGDPSHPHSGATPAMDFGRAGSPGNNTFRCNSTGLATSAGADVLIDASAKAIASTTFFGNFWDHAPPTIASPTDVHGVVDGTDVVVLPTAMGASVDFSGASIPPNPCPSGRTPGP